uniref:Myb-like domain-containing protein n=1 Tax=Oryza barthii TaxID=65489 RepID=A0A0D3GWJ5_9ORYZ
MEFIDDDWDYQPRARVIHSRSNANSNGATTTSSSQPTRSLPHTAACAAAAVALLAAAYYLLPDYQVLASVVVWVASSLLLAPFAPSSATGGDVSVGRGDPLPEQEPVEEPVSDPAPTSRRGRRQSSSSNPTPPPPKPSDPIAPPPPRHAAAAAAAAATAVSDGGEAVEDAGEWTDQEMDILRRQMVKHPAGEPQRWEKIAAAFGGRRTPESVIRAAKSGGGAAAAGASFDQFLRKRKPLDPRSEATDAGGGNAGGGGGESGDGSWSAGDDRALLNALKEFPKDTAMRWEKVAVAVPGKTKAACMKRVTELKRDFRSSKAASEAAP